MVIRGFHTELEAVYEEYNINMASDGTKTYTAFLKKLCPSHPYGTQSTIGTQEHLKNPSITNIKNYFHKYYEPNNIAICMSGDLNYDKTVATINKYFGSWEGLWSHRRAAIRTTTGIYYASGHYRHRTRIGTSDDGMAVRPRQYSAGRHPRYNQ